MTSVVHPETLTSRAGPVRRSRSTACRSRYRRPATTCRRARSRRRRCSRPSSARCSRGAGSMSATASTCRGPGDFATAMIGRTPVVVAARPGDRRAARLPQRVPPPRRAAPRRQGHLRQADQVPVPRVELRARRRTARRAVPRRVLGRRLADGARPDPRRHGRTAGDGVPRSDGPAARRVGRRAAGGARPRRRGGLGAGVGADVRGRRELEAVRRERERRLPHPVRPRRAHRRARAGVRRSRRSSRTARTRSRSSTRSTSRRAAIRRRPRCGSAASSRT